MNGLFFSKDHIWVIRDGDIAVLGISDYAQNQLGNIMFLNLPEEGEKLEIGKCFGDIESIKTVSDLISPITGEVVKVNSRLIDEPEAVNTEPYQSWFVRVRVDKVSGELMNEEAYLEYKENKDV